jgi:hypothetical protein
MQRPQQRKRADTGQNEAAAPAGALSRDRSERSAVAPPPAQQTVHFHGQFSTARGRCATGRRRAAKRRQRRRGAPNRTPQTSTSYNNSAAPNVPRESSRAARARRRRASPEYREVTIPAGTALPLEMTSTISSASAEGRGACQREVAQRNHD